MEAKTEAKMDEASEDSPSRAPQSDVQRTASLRSRATNNNTGSGTSGGSAGSGTSMTDSPSEGMRASMAPPPPPSPSSKKESVARSELVPSGTSIERNAPMRARSPSNSNMTDIATVKQKVTTANGGKKVTTLQKGKLNSAVKKTTSMNSFKPPLSPGPPAAPKTSRRPLGMSSDQPHGLKKSRIAPAKTDLKKSAKSGLKPSLSPTSAGQGGGLRASQEDADGSSRESTENGVDMLTSCSAPGRLGSDLLDRNGRKGKPQLAIHNSAPVDLGSEDPDESEMSMHKRHSASAATNLLDRNLEPSPTRLGQPTPGSRSPTGSRASSSSSIDSGNARSRRRARPQRSARNRSPSRSSSSSSRSRRSRSESSSDRSADRRGREREPRGPSCDFDNGREGVREAAKTGSTLKSQQQSRNNSQESMKQAQSAKSNKSIRFDDQVGASRSHRSSRSRTGTRNPYCVEAPYEDRGRGASRDRDGAWNSTGRASQERRRSYDSDISSVLLQEMKEVGPVRRALRRCCCFCMAPFLFGISGYVIYQNERNTICQQRPLRAIEKAVEVDCDASGEDYKDGDLVLFTCSVNSLKQGPLFATGDFYNQSLRGAGLASQVEMFQCVETLVEGTYTYRLDWAPQWYNADTFSDPETAKLSCGRVLDNPWWPGWLPAPGIVKAKEVHLGPFTLRGRFAGRVLVGEPLASTFIAPEWRGWKQASEFYYSEALRTDPESSAIEYVGDVRVRYYGNYQKSVYTVLGKSINGTIEPWVPQPHRWKWLVPDRFTCPEYYIFEMRPDVYTKEDFQSEVQVQSDIVVTSSYRMLGILLLWVALGRCMIPCEVVSECILPCVGQELGEYQETIACFTACIPAVMMCIGMTSALYYATSEMYWPVMGAMSFIVLAGSIGWYVYRMTRRPRDKE